MIALLLDVRLVQCCARLKSTSDNSSTSRMCVLTTDGHLLRLNNKTLVLLRPQLLEPAVILLITSLKFLSELASLTCYVSCCFYS